tara:strand:+ start:2929 stop:3168 length:240 start_codon:yes stop_codon:yes gene_type:complete
MWKLTKKYFKDLWAFWWGLTTIDEKAKATGKEIKRRAKNVKKELQDVGKAMKEVGNQIGDIDDAVKGKKRKGRKNEKNK